MPISVSSPFHAASVVRITARHVRRMHQPDFGPTGVQSTWTPALNVYQRPCGLEICVDLAGVARRDLAITAEPGRLILRGHRAAPEPDPATARSEGGDPSMNQGPGMKILAMEIDYGPFCRVLPIPPQVILGRIQSHYHDGLLWISLPFGP